MPDKEEYVVHQAVLYRAEFTNLSKETLCFPEPAFDHELPEQGFVTIKALAPPTDPGGELILQGAFIDHVDGRDTRTHEALVREIKESWIWLSPNAIHVTPPASVRVDLDRPGQWSFEAEYHPPEGSFGPAIFRKDVDSAAREAGCAVPHGEVAAEAATINVSLSPAP